MWIYRPETVKYQKINESIRLNSSIRISTFLNIHYGAGFKKRTKVLRLKNGLQPRGKKHCWNKKRGRRAQFRKIMIILIIIIVHCHDQSLLWVKNQDFRVQDSIGLAKTWASIAVIRQAIKDTGDNPPVSGSLLWEECEWRHYLPVPVDALCFLENCGLFCLYFACGFSIPFADWLLSVL